MYQIQCETNPVCSAGNKWSRLSWRPRFVLASTIVLELYASTETGGSPPLSLPAVFVHLSSEPLSSFKTASSSVLLHKVLFALSASQLSVNSEFRVRPYTQTHVGAPTCFYMGTHVLSHGNISCNTCIMHLSGKGKHLRVSTSSSEWWG